MATTGNKRAFDEYSSRDWIAYCEALNAEKKEVEEFELELTKRDN